MFICPGRMKGALPMNMMRISLGCNSSDRGNQFAALASHGIGQDLSENAAEAPPPPAESPLTAALFADAERKAHEAGFDRRTLWAFEP